jgi:hypothetical protein
MCLLNAVTTVGPNTCLNSRLATLQIDAWELGMFEYLHLVHVSQRLKRGGDNASQPRTKLPQASNGTQTKKQLFEMATV